MSITNEQIAELRDHDKAMAPVPWDAKCEGERHLYLVAENGEHRHVAIGMKSMGIRFEDFRGIAATRNALPDLLTELERLRAAVEAAGGLLELIAAERLKQLPGMRVTQWADDDSTARCEACNSDIVDTTGLSEENAIARIAHRDGCPVASTSAALAAFQSALEAIDAPATQPGEGEG